ncbi:nuclease domain containing hypothetical protein [Phytophthora palmivora]|uniref:Uncharacterized protein n=1 Tax=Phytophthora palmivora TaxID=4796 RepID=A0A2P4YTQ0_9STRA|nr:nuclease domain containing hypothetical protein [Phytophthora palmivora]
MARGKRLNDSEHAMIVNAFNFFLKGRQEDNKVSGLTRELVHQCLGTPTSTIGAVRRAHQAREHSDSSEKQTSGDSRGGPRSYEDEDVSPAINAYINKCNIERQSITARIFSEEVFRRTSIQISRHAINAYIKKCNRERQST